MATATAPQPTVSKPWPQQGEDHSSFVVRAHYELMGQVPDAMQRNRVIWDAWDAASGDTEKQRADAFFSQENYDKRPDVCYFAEHETQSTGPDGSPVVRRYDAKKLGEIIAENNHRIADVDAYTTVIDRHTSPAGQRDPSPPRTLGAAGPFRLGMIGRVNPRFAIFADEYTRRNLAGEVAARPGRSVEVLTLRANGKTYINPIAAISEAPRLPLPVQFSFAGSDGDVIERYSAMAPVPASPGGGNTYVDKFDSQSPAGDPNQQPQESGNMLTDQDVRQIVAAIMGTEQMQWVSQQMQGAGMPPGGAPPEAGPDPMAGGAPPAAGPPQAGPPQAGPPMGPPDASAPTPEQKPQQFMGSPMSAPAGPAGMMRYQADGESYFEDEETDMNSHEFAEIRDQYAADRAELMAELAEAKGRLASLEVERADASRSARLREISSRLPIDVDMELDRCLYSAGSSMDDDQFENHCEVIEQYAAKAIERIPMVPQGEAQRQRTDREQSQYSARLSAEIVQLNNEYANRDIQKPYAELREEAQQRLNAAA